MARQLKLVVTFLFLMALALAAAAQGETWQINVKDADIREFATQISTITGDSFVVDPRVKGNVTIISSAALDKQGVYELFLSVLRVHGFAAVPSGKVTRIVQQILAKQSSNPKDFAIARDSQELITAVIPVRNSPSAELVKILRPLLPQYGHIAGIAQPNVLIVSDHSENIARLQEIVQRIDVADNQAITILDLKEAWVEDMLALLKELAPDQLGTGAAGPNRVTIVASERTNSMVIRGEQETVDKMVELVGKLDVPANRAGSTQVISLDHADAEELADILMKIVGAGAARPDTPGVAVNIQPDVSLNALVIRANPSTMLELKEIIQSLDVRRSQVLIEAAIVEVTADFTKDLGTELFVADGDGGSLPLGLTAPSGTLANILQNLALGTPGPVNLGTEPLTGIGRINRDGTSFALIIRALATNTDVDLLSTPSITTMQNQQAKIVVGQNVPFRTGSTIVNTESNPFTTIQREDVGLTMEVTPHIQDGGTLRLEIHQEVSEIDTASLNAIGTQGSADLITNKRTIDTTIVVDDQEVIIIGGLIRDKETLIDSRVPVLGRIPLIGALFKSKSTDIEKQHLLVFIRPTILKSREAVAEVTKREFLDLYEVEIEGRDPADAISDLFDGKAP